MSNRSVQVRIGSDLEKEIIRIQAEFNKFILDNGFGNEKQVKKRQVLDGVVAPVIKTIRPEELITGMKSGSKGKRLKFSGEIRV